MQDMALKETTSVVYGDQIYMYWSSHVLMCTNTNVNCQIKKKMAECVIPVVKQGPVSLF